jgi:hypothetical protein
VVAAALLTIAQPSGEFSMEEFSDVVSLVSGMPILPPEAPPIDGSLDNAEGFMENIVMLPTFATIGEAPPIVIPLDSVELALRAALKVEAAMALVVATLEMAYKYGDAAALVGARQVLDGLYLILERLDAE